MYVARIIPSQLWAGAWADIPTGNVALDGCGDGQMGANTLMHTHIMLKKLFTRTRHFNLVTLLC